MDRKIIAQTLEKSNCLSVGDYVRNGTKKPGEITDITEFKGNRQIFVLWEGDRVPTPAEEKVLTPIASEMMKYWWDDNCKLIRYFDEKPCDDFLVLRSEMERLNQEIELCSRTIRTSRAGAERTSTLGNRPGQPLAASAPDVSSLIKQKQIAYCQGRWDATLFEKFSIGDRVKNKRGELATVTDFRKRKDGLMTLVVTTDEEKVIALCPTTVKHASYSEQFKISHSSFSDLIPISSIRRDGGTQQRVKINSEVVLEYAESMRNGDRFPPVKVKYDGTNYWLTDGFHTTEAAYSIGKTEIEAIVTSGSRREAVLESVGVNAAHGLRRTNADKRCAVMTLLNDEEWSKWSDREIARRTKVHHSTVAKIRSELTGYLASDNQRNYKDKYGNTSQMNIEKIGKPIDKPDPVLNKDRENLTGYLASDNPEDYNNKYNSRSIGDLVKIESDRTDPKLVGYDQSYAVVTKVEGVTVDLKVGDTNLTCIHKQFIKPYDRDEKVKICGMITAWDLAKIISAYGSIENALLTKSKQAPPFKGGVPSTALKCEVTSHFEAGRLDVSDSI